MKTNNETLAETNGTIVNSKVEINTSNILTLLIKEAAKCESYASDLFIDWQNILDDLKDISAWRHKEYWFGFRDMGIDHKEFIDLRGLDNNIYRTIWVLELQQDKGSVIATLSKVR